MRKFIFVLLTLLLVSPFSFAMKGIIWQPQNRDSQVTDTAMHLPSQNSARYCLSGPQLRNRLV